MTYLGSEGLDDVGGGDGGRVDGGAAGAIGRRQQVISTIVQLQHDSIQ